MTDKRLAEIEARAAKATTTEGLFVSKSNCGDAVIFGEGDPGEMYPFMHFDQVEDAEFWISASGDIRALIVHIRDLREKIEQLELLESRSAREAERERKRAEFWRGQCEKRAKLIASVEWSDAERGWLACPECGGAMPGDPNFDESHPRHPKYHRDHYPGCDLARLMQMPEEPKP